VTSHPRCGLQNGHGLRSGLELHLPMPDRGAKVPIVRSPNRSGLLAKVGLASTVVQASRGVEAEMEIECDEEVEAEAEADAKPELEAEAKAEGELRQGPVRLKRQQERQGYFARFLAAN